MHDIEGSYNFHQSALLIPQQELRSVNAIKFYTLVVLILMIIASLFAQFLFSIYTWVSELYEQLIKMFYLLILLYVFRSTKYNSALYEPMPVPQRNTRKSLELNSWDNQWNNHQAQNKSYKLSSFYLVDAPRNRSE